MCKPGLLQILSGQDEMTVCIAVMSEASDSNHYLVCFQSSISTCVTCWLLSVSGQDEMTVCNSVRS